jgi:hypothetical protein
MEYKTETPVKDRLKKKVKKKNNEESSSEPSQNQNDIFQMLGKVSEILQQNPEMLQKVNKCVSNIIDNKDLMEKLSSQIKDNMDLSSESLQSDIKDIVTQTLESSDETDSNEACLKESKQ